MSPKFSLSPSNEHYNQPTPQGRFLQLILDRVGSIPDVWYCDTMNMPHIHNLKKYYTGTLILYCWWDPARDILTKHLDDMDLNVIIITPDVEYAGVHSKQTVIGWKYQYGLHMDLIKPSRPGKFTSGNKFLCMMRNHKSERIQFLQKLWQQDMLNNHISYLGQVNTEDNGRANRTIEDILQPRRFIDSEFTHNLDNNFVEWCIQNLPLELPADLTQQETRNTDFYTVGNIDWYDQTDYSIVLETYWAKTQFLTEKSFKPIIAQHPFINLGNRTTTLLKDLGFDVFDDILNTEYDSMTTEEKINNIDLNIHFDVDPKRLAKNLLALCDLRQQAIDEQIRLVDHLECSLTN